MNERSEFLKYFDICITHDTFSRITVSARLSKSNDLPIDKMFYNVNDPKQHLLSCIVKSNLSDNFHYISVFDILIKSNTVFFNLIVPMTTQSESFTINCIHVFLMLLWIPIYFMVKT